VLSRCALLDTIKFGAKLLFRMTKTNVMRYHKILPEKEAVVCRDSALHARYMCSSLVAIAAAIKHKKKHVNLGMR